MQAPQADYAATNRTWAMSAAIIGLGLALYLPGINWGLPAVVSWSQDTIAGVRTLGAMETWPHHWQGRYPPLHYMVLAAAYQPVVRHWRATGQATIDPKTGRESLASPHPPKIGLLILIARLVSVAMAIGTGLVLMRCTLLATGAPEAGLLAAVTFMCGAGFTYFAHLGNVDVPSVFWFSLSLLFYLKALQSLTIRNAAWLGLFASLAVCTKDGWAGIYPGMALVLLAKEFRAQLKLSDSWLAAILASFRQWRWLVGLAVFIAPFVLLNAIPWNPQAFVARLGSENWVAGQRQFGTVGLLAETVRQAAVAVGWPMVVALAAVSMTALVRQTRLAISLLVPILSYYLIVLQSIHFVYERFLFFPIMMLTVLGAAVIAPWLQRGQMLGFYSIWALVTVPTVAYAVAVDFEMRYDSRYAAEAWFSKNLPGDANVAVLTGNTRRFSPQYQPRLHELGYTPYTISCRPDAFSNLQPHYLVLSSYDEQDFDPTAALCIQMLRDGRLGYQQEATFGPRYLGTGRSWLGLAGWGVQPPGKISPTIEVFRRQAPKD